MSDIRAFDLSIELGNEAMRSPEDVARALRAVAVNVEYLGSFEAGEQHTLRNVNGNTIGSWVAR
jgi:hypothetical protein